MRTTEAIANLYNLIAKSENKSEARQLVVAIMNNALFDIEEEGIALTEMELEKRITSQVQDLLKVAKNTKVA